MKFAHLLLSILFFLPQESQAQLVGTIQSGRPGQAIGAGTPGVGAFQLQSGLDYQTIEQGVNELTNRTLNNVIRVGVADRVELRSVIDYSQDTQSGPEGSVDLDGLSQFQLGVRYTFIKEETKYLPVFCLQTQWRFAGASGPYRRDEIATNFTMSAVKSLTDRWGVTTNAGMSYDGLTPVPLYNWVLSVSNNLGSDWGAVVELYGSERQGVRSQYFGAGWWYLLHDNFQLDTYISTGENRGIKEFYGTVGISWRTLALSPSALAIP